MKCNLLRNDISERGANGLIREKKREERTFLNKAVA